MQNLWAELNNEQAACTNDEHPSVGVPSMAPARKRRLTEHDLLTALRAWLLHEYVVPYCRMLSTTRIYRHCYWIDALGSIETRAPGVAGRDVSRFYEIDTRVHSSSPVTVNAANEHAQQPQIKARKKAAPSMPPALQSIASLAGMLAQENKPIALHGLLLEAGSSRRKETRATGNEQAETPASPRAPARGAPTIHDSIPSSIVGAGLAPPLEPTPAPASTPAPALPKENGIVRASWLEVAPVLLESIGQSPAIFLLNPFGPTLFTYDSLAHLYQRTAPTELCLYVSHKQVMAHLASPRDKGALTNLLRSDRWKTLPTGEGETQQAIDGLIALLIASMQRHFVAVQRIDPPVQVRPALVETAPYTLLFATRRQDSLAAMNDALCLYRRRLQEQSRRGLLAEEWFAAQQQERYAEEMQHLCQRILQQGRAQRIRRWPDLRQHLLNASFGQYTLSEYDEMIQQLLVQGEVRCEWRRKPAEEHIVPGNDDTLLWQ